MGGSDNSFSKTARWHFENASRVLRLDFSCDGIAIVLWSHAHCENDEGVNKSRVSSQPALFSGSGDKTTPLKKGPYLSSMTGTRRPCQLCLELSEQKLKPESCAL